MTASSTAPHVRRRDLQGLRAFAVLVVVGDHLLHRPAGGFIGVDVFFVLSGYLITGILQREYERTGRVSLLKFFTRRIKRTVPVAWAVIGATTILFALLLPYATNQQARQDALSATTFWVNWQLIADGTDYLKATAPPSAFQHYWSLAVEEQFYLVWPVIVLAVVLVLRRRPRVVPVALVVMFAAVAVLSFVWAEHVTGTEPASAYFSTFTRAWELAVGALLAMAATLTRRIPRSIGVPLAWAGMLMLVGGIAVIDENSRFPAPWALLPVIATALVIISSEGREAQDVYPLTNPLSQYIGNISFSIYLWHFPVVVALQALRVDSTPLADGSALALMLGLSTLSYHLIEEPFRRSSWRFWSSRPALRPRRSVLAITSVGLLVVSVSVTGAALQRTPPTAVPTAEMPALWRTVAGTAADDSERQAAIAAALAVQPVPTKLIEAVSHGADRRAAAWIKDGCMEAQTVKPCVFGDADARRTAVVYGDSIAASYVPAVRAALRGADWRIVVYTAGQCPAVDVRMLNADRSANTACDDFHRRARAAIEASKPDVLVITSSFLSPYSLADSSRPPLEVWSAAAQSTFRWMSDSAGRVLVLDPPPLVPAAEDCLPVAADNQWCLGAVRQDYVDLSLANRAAALGIGRKNVDHVATIGWWCDRAGLCPNYIGTDIPLANDGEHPSEGGSAALGPLLRKVWPVSLTNGR
jgi:peptidoglycan/LPS O-acetylase OafA/YrhL